MSPGERATEGKQSPSAKSPEITGTFRDMLESIRNVREKDLGPRN